MAFAATDKVVLGSVAFAVFWVLAVFPAVPFLPIGRTAGSLLGAVLMVIFKILTPSQAYAAIDLSILGLLFGTMVVSVYLERADMFKYLGRLLSWKCRGTKDLLCRICFISAISSSVFTNDTSCIVLTEFVLKVARQNQVPLHPFLLALASSANIGSSATPIGNPQNLVIAILSGISFEDFVVGIIPAMLVGVVLNAVILLVMYWKVLSGERDEEKGSVELVISEVDANSHHFSPATMSHLTPLDCQGLSPAADDAIDQPRKRTSSKEEAVRVQSMVEEEGDLAKGGKMARLTLLRKACVYLVTVGMLAAFLIGFNMSWTAVTTALVLVVLDFKDARPCLEKVSYSLLVFFCGMFITIEGFNQTGIPSSFWNLMEPYAGVNHVSGIAVLAIVVLLLSNLCSNVPTGFCSSDTVIYSQNAFNRDPDHDPANDPSRNAKAPLLSFYSAPLLSFLVMLSVMFWVMIAKPIYTDRHSLISADIKLYRPVLLPTMTLIMTGTITLSQKSGVQKKERGGAGTLCERVMVPVMMRVLVGSIFGLLSMATLPTKGEKFLLLGARVAASAAAISPTAEKKAWLILAWVSTVAGNLSLLGSAANLIVCEQARRAQSGGYTLGFWTHLKFGVPSTLIVTAIGLFLVRG